MLLMMGENTVCMYIGAVDCVVGYMLLLMHYVISQGEIADIEARITKLEKKMKDDNDDLQ